MSLKSKPTAKKKKGENDKGRKVYKRILPQSTPNDLVKEKAKQKHGTKFLWSAVIYSRMGLEWFRVLRWY